MKYGDKLRRLRNEKGLSQKDLTDKLHINRSTYARYETSSTQPDFDTLSKLADFFEVTTDDILGRSDNSDKNNVSVIGKEIDLTNEELELFNELKKHPVMFQDLISNPKKSVKEFLQYYRMKKIFLEDEEEYGNGFGELED